MDVGGESAQIFVVTINWSAESGVRLTEGDVRESIEEMVGELDEDATVDIAEKLDHNC